MTENGFEYVDLGLPSGTMWATCNVGADKPEDPGLLFQFGRVDGYKYGDENNQFRVNDQNKQDTGSALIPLTTSCKTYNIGETLNLKDDAAHVHMGGKWRIPTKNELKELLDNTTYDVATINGVLGMLFTSNINNKRLLFLLLVIGIMAALDLPGLALTRGLLRCILLMSIALTASTAIRVAMPVLPTTTVLSPCQHVVCLRNKI